MLSQPRTDRDPAFEYGRVVGVVEGLQLALDAAEEALRKEDDA